MKVRFVEWDWKETPRRSEIQQAIREVRDKGKEPCVNDVDTGGDCYAVVISSMKISEGQAQKIYDKYCDESDEEKDPLYTVVEIPDFKNTKKKAIKREKKK